MSNSALATIDSLYFQLQVSRYLASAGLAIITYDWFLSLSVEVRYIWQARWTLVKAIFLINRYFVPVTIAFGVYGWSGKASWIGIQSCKAYVLTDAYSMLAFFSSLHWIVAMRAWALWSRTYLVGVVIWGSFLLYLSATAVVTAKALITYKPTPVFGVNVCFGSLPGYLWSIWLPSILFESLIFALTAAKAIQLSKKSVETAILTTLYRDGFLYFVFICLNSFANLLIWAIAPQGYVVVYKFFSTSICAVAGAHLVLDLIHVGHLAGASQRSGQAVPKGKALPGFGGFGGLGYTQSHGEIFEMMSAPSFMQDPPEYNDQAIRTNRSMNGWVPPAEWQSFSEYTSVTTDNTTRSRTALLTVHEQEASQDKLSYPPARVGRKLSKSIASSTQRKGSGTHRPPKISAPLADTLVKNGVPSSPPPAFSSPTTYYSTRSMPERRMEPTSSTPGSRTPGYLSPTSPVSPTRERTIKFEQKQYQYRSSPQAI